MKLLVTACVVGIGVAAGTHARACAPTYFVVPPVAGETHQEMLVRSRSAQQEQFRAAAESIYLAEVSEERRVGSSEVETTYTPIRVFAGEVAPAHLRARENAGSTCRRGERVGDLIVVYAGRDGDRSSIVALLRPDEVLDPEIAPLLRDAARRRARGLAFGELPTLSYPE